MNPNKGMLNVLRGLVCAAAVAAAAVASAAAPQKTPPPPKDKGLVQVEVGTHRLMRQTDAVRRVAVGDPTVADVNVINNRDLLITGKKLGLTSLLVWTRPGNTPDEYRVRVGDIKDPTKAAKPDPELSQATIERGAGLSGQLPNLQAYRRAKVAATPLKDKVDDTSTVAGDMQVMTEVKIAEVNRKAAQQYGFNLNYSASRDNGKTNISFNGPDTPTQLLTGAFNLVFDRLIGANETIGGMLSILEGRGLVRVLAEPQLTTMSGQTASFLAGGEFPVPVNQGGGGTSAITIEFKQFGIRLALTPTVLSKDRIALKIAPEVSDLDFSAGIQVGGVAVPALTVRRTDTMVELGDGETFLISGLVSNNLVANVDKVPWLGDIPILGAFFKSVKNERSEKELIMVVTPHLVKPLARGSQLPSLPGAKYDDYRPGFSGLILEETGKFDTNAYGFSR
jgi:pilus assembly protein CpaC